MLKIVRNFTFEEIYAEFEMGTIRASNHFFVYHKQL